jgi:hypothetical protein
MRRGRIAAAALQGRQSREIPCIGNRNGMAGMQCRDFVDQEIQGKVVTPGLP